MSLGLGLITSSLGLRAHNLSIARQRRARGGAGEKTKRGKVSGLGGLVSSSPENSPIAYLVIQNEKIECGEQRRGFNTKQQDTKAERGREGGRGTALEATKGQTDGFLRQLPYKCYLKEISFAGD